MVVYAWSVPITLFLLKQQQICTMFSFQLLCAKAKKFNIWGQYKKLKSCLKLKTNDRCTVFLCLTIIGNLKHLSFSFSTPASTKISFFSPHLRLLEFQFYWLWRTCPVGAHVHDSRLVLHMCCSSLVPKCVQQEMVSLKWKKKKKRKKVWLWDMFIHKWQSSSTINLFFLLFLLFFLLFFWVILHASAGHTLTHIPTLIRKSKTWIPGPWHSFLNARTGLSLEHLIM